MKKKPLKKQHTNIPKENKLKSKNIKRNIEKFYEISSQILQIIRLTISFSFRCFNN